MAANDVIQYHDPANKVTAIAGAAILGKRFVVISATRSNEMPVVIQSTASVAHRNAFFGVASRDKAVGDNVGVIRTGIVPVIAGAVNLTAGMPVRSDANGAAVVAAAGEAALGVAIEDALAGADVLVALGKFTAS